MKMMRKYPIKGTRMTTSSRIMMSLISNKIGYLYRDISGFARELGADHLRTLFFMKMGWR
jgi:hypothetical protein